MRNAVAPKSLPLWGRWPSAARSDEVACRPHNAMSKIIYKASLKPFAQKLRRDMTPQERHLWYDFLRSYPVAFRRQKQFGGYIVDCYCANARLVVELDGSQHYEEDGMARDQARDRYLHGWGLAVLRYSNYDVDRNFDGVCYAIDAAVRERLWAEE